MVALVSKAKKWLMEMYNCCISVLQNVVCSHVFALFFDTFYVSERTPWLMFNYRTILTDDIFKQKWFLSESRTSLGTKVFHCCLRTMAELRTFAVVGSARSPATPQAAHAPVRPGVFREIFNISMYIIYLYYAYQYIIYIYIYLGKL